MPMVSDEIVEKGTGEADTPVVSFARRLRTGELLTGTPTAVEQTTSALTISNVAKNAAAITVEGETVAINQGVQFKVSGGTAGTLYTILVTCGTDATPARTVELLCRLMVL